MFCLLFSSSSEVSISFICFKCIDSFVSCVISFIVAYISLKAFTVFMLGAGQ